MINTPTSPHPLKILLASKLMCAISHLDDGECVLKSERIKLLHECISEINTVLDQDKKINVNAKMDNCVSGKIFERFRDSYKKIRGGVLTCYKFDEVVDEARDLVGYVNLLMYLYAIKGDYHGKITNSVEYTRTLSREYDRPLDTQIQDHEA